MVGACNLWCGFNVCLVSFRMAAKEVDQTGIIRIRRLHAIERGSTYHLFNLCFEITTRRILVAVVNYCRFTLDHIHSLSMNFCQGAPPLVLRLR